MKRIVRAVAALALVPLLGGVGVAAAQAPIEDELVLQTPVSKFIVDAAAQGFILIIVASACLILIKWVAGTRMGGMFG